MLQKILLPLDGSELAEQTLPHAISLAREFKAELIVTWIIQPSYIMVEYGGVIPADFIEAEQQAVESYLSKIETRLKNESVSVRTIALHHTLPADGIINLAEREAVDLIMMCTHGRSGLGRWIHGSVATKVLQYAPCPVYLVKAKSVGETPETDEVMTVAV